MSTLLLEPLPLEQEDVNRYAAWREDHRTCISGTQISAILGLNKFMKPVDIWAEKVGIEIPFDDTANPILAGRAFERAILTETARRADRSITFADPHELIRVPGFPLLGATLDGTWSDTGCPIDAKNIRYKTPEWGEDGTDNFPDSYKLQLHVQMMALGVQSANLAVCFSGQDFFLYAMERDPEVDTLVVTAAAEWWTKHVVGNTPPDADGSDNYTEFLKVRFAKNRLDLIPASDDLKTLIAQLKAVKAEAAEKLTEQARLEQLIKSMIGEHEGIEGLCTWRNNKDGESTDWKTMACALIPPEIFQARLADYTKPTTGARVLRLKK